MKKHYRVFLAALCALALAGAFALIGCSSGDSGTKDDKSEPAAETETTEAPEVELQVFAANSLEKALPEVQALYTEKTGVTFADTQFKASGDLVSQLDGGATADVLICASKSTMDKAETNGSIDLMTRTDMFLNDLVICAAEDANYQIDSVEDLGTNDEITSIAIGEPNAVPAGKYATQSLESAGLCTTTTDDEGTITVTWADSIANKINAGADKVGTVASYVKEGQCQVGFVYSSDIYRYDGLKAIYTVPADMHKNIVYPGAVCTSANDAAAAQDFIDFCLTDPEAQRVFSEYGFQLAA